VCTCTGGLIWSDEVKDCICDGPCPVTVSTCQDDFMPSNDKTRCVPKFTNCDVPRDIQPEDL